MAIHLYLPGFKPWIDHATGAILDLTLYRDDELAAKRFRLAVRLGIVLRVENDLCHPVAIS